MKQGLMRAAALLVLPGILMFATPQPARADSASTAAWAAAAALIVGTIYYDSQHRPYYKDRSGHMHYVSAGAASYYSSHHWQSTPASQRRWQDSHGSWHHGCC
jgi:hypothetical protein